MKLFENDYVVLSLDEKVPCLEWIGKQKFAPSEEFRFSEEKSLELYHEYKDKYPGLQWFVDTRLFKAVSHEDMQWVTDNILPKFAKQGLKKEAFIVPKSAIGKMNIKSYKSIAGDVIDIKMFDNVKDAKDWLKE